jgi:hypothetical protein
MASKVTQRDYGILQHVLRYRITTRKAIYKTLFPKTSMNAVTKVTTRLVSAGWLNRHALATPSCYFTLSHRASLLLGAPETVVTTALEHSALQREYAILAYCCFSEAPRTRLTVEELQEEHPYLFFAEQKSDAYYSDPGHRPSLLGFVFADDDGSPQQVVAKCRQDLTARCKRMGFRKMVGEGRFRLAVLTSTPGRAVAIRDGLKSQTWPNGLKTAVAVASGLLNLALASGGSAAGGHSDGSRRASRVNGDGIGSGRNRVARANIS